MIILGKRIGLKKLFLIVIVFYLFVILIKIFRNSITASSIDDFQPHLNLDDVGQLLRAGEDTGITPVLFDPLILQAWSSNNFVTKSGSCLFLCHVVGPLFFAVTDQDLNGKEYFLSRLAQLGFIVTQFFNTDGKRSHVFIKKSGSPLHVIILHWRDAGYYRQYQVTGTPYNMAVVKEYITVEAWNILNMDRAYERFETTKGNIDGFKLTVPKHVATFLNDFREAKFIPCNQTQANYFYLKHKEEASPERKRFEHLAWKVLAKSKTVLDQLGIPFWLSSGTLLGFFRQCKIIPWAVDVDLGIFVDNYSPNLISSFEKAGLKLVHRFGKVEDSFELSFKENDLKVDLFFFYTEGATVWNGGTQARTGKKFKYIFPNFSLCWTEFLDLRVRIPCQTQDYIEANYGKNWFVPVTQWDWKSSPPNVQENGVWPEHEWNEVIVVKS